MSLIAYLINTLAGVFPRVLSTWNADLTNTNQILCQIHIFVYFVWLTVAFWVIMLATVDRWLSSSRNVHRRQRSTLKNAQCGMICIIIVSTIIEIQQIFCYEANLVNSPFKCYSKTMMCGIVSDLLFALVSVLFPLLLMFIFGLMIISNTCQIRIRLQPMSMTIDTRIDQTSTIASNGRQNQQKEIDRQLLIMLFVQVLILLVFTLPFTLSNLHTIITNKEHT